MPSAVPRDVSFDSYSDCSVFFSEAVLVCRANHTAGFTHLACEPVSAFWGKVFNRGGGNSLISWRQDSNLSSDTSVCQACATLGSDNRHFQSSEPTLWAVQASCVSGGHFFLQTDLISST